MYLFSTFFSLPLYRHQILSPWVCVLIFLNVAAGMSVSVIMKQFDNIVKVFLVFLSLIVSSVVCSVCCLFQINGLFVISSISVSICILQFNLFPKVTHDAFHEEKDSLMYTN